MNQRDVLWRGDQFPCNSCCNGPEWRWCLVALPSIPQNNSCMLLKVPLSYLHFSIPPSLTLFLIYTFLILSLLTHFLGNHHHSTPCHHCPTEESLTLPKEPLPLPVIPRTGRPSTLLPSQLQTKATLTHTMGTIPLPTKSTFIQPTTVDLATGWGRRGGKSLYQILWGRWSWDTNAEPCEHFLFYNHNL